MAVLGGLQHNKDPRKLHRFTTRNEKMALYHEGSYYLGNSSTFWGYGLFEGAQTSTNYSADTVKQIYSVSGSEGFFYGAISPEQSSQADYVTWTIVVDGVSYSIPQGNHTKSEQDARFILGKIFQPGRYNGTSTGSANYSWDSNRGSINLNAGGTNTDAQQIGHPFGQGGNDHESLVYFTNSLTVSCTPTAAQSGTWDRISGIVVRLID